MKTLRFLIAFIFLFALVVGNTYSQSKKVTNCETWTTYEAPCLGVLEGEIEHCFTDFGNGKIQQKWKGILYGDDDTYTVSEVMNCNLTKLFVLGLSDNGTQTWTMSIVSATTGMVVAEYHHTYHITFNSDGEVVVETWKQWIDCY